MNAAEEHALVRKAQQGDREALGLLWDAITPKLFGYLVNTLRDKTTAEDVFQTTWLKAVQGLPKFEVRTAAFSAWLFAIARNECRQYWRKEKQATSPDLDAEAFTDQTEVLQAGLFIEQVLGKLSADDQELLRLRYIADLSVKDIARVLHINFVAVRVRISRALARARTVATKNL